MKISGFHIDGYGVHRDLGDTDLPDGLTIVAGPNEAGKTTLQHFLVGMLFGFTPVNRPDHHAPLNGGTYGGRLFVTDETGRQLTIHRGARKSSLRLTDEDGPLPDAELTDLLGGASRDLYQSIFSVHLDELAELKALTDEQVRDRVFSAGILGAGRTAQRALATLTEQRDALLKPGGRSPDKYQIKRLQAQLSEARAHLAEAQRGSTGLPALTTRLAALAADRTRLRQQRDQLQAERSLLAAVAELWPAWAAAADARAELERLGTVAAVPAEVAERLDRASERHADLDAEQAKTARALHDATNALESIEPAGPALEHDAAIIELTGRAAAERERQKVIAELAARVDQLSQDLAAALTQLGPDCDEAWLDAHPDRAEAAAELRTLADEVSAARHHREQATAHSRRTAAELEDARAELDAAQQVLANSPHHPTDRARQAVEDASVLVRLVSERDAASRRLATVEATPAAETSARAVPRFAVGALLVVGVAILAVGAVAGTNGAPALGALAALAGLAVTGLGLAIRRSARHPRESPSNLPTEALVAEIDEIDTELTPILDALGLDARPTLVEATNLSTKAAHLADEAAHLDRQRRDVAQQREALTAKASRHRERSAAELADADARLRTARDAWTDWLSHQQLPTSLDDRSATAVLEALSRAHRVRRDLSRVRQDHQRATDQHADYTRKITDLVATSGITLSADPTTSPLQAVVELASALSAAQDVARQRTNANQAVAAARQAHDNASARASEAATALQAALDDLGAKTVDDARTTIERANQAARLRTTIAQADRDLTTAVGAKPERLERARTLLGQADPTRWAEDLRQLDLQLREIDDRADDVTAEAAHLSRERDQLERSADVPRAELHVADLEAQLTAAVTRWASLTVAHQQVEGTLARYQRDRQPDVVKRAAARFAQVTSGRYPRLEVRGQHIVAIDDTGREVEATALSQGATEQLYLCMRIALAESFARTAPLPLLLDDIIVNADGGRMPKLADTIADVATEHQVFMFTCHDATVELLRAASPGAKVITLEPSSARHRMGLAAG